MENKNAFQLCDSETEEVLGTVLVTNEVEPKNDELFDGWRDFNKLGDGNISNVDIDLFVEWFNNVYETQIIKLTVNLIQW